MPVHAGRRRCDASGGRTARRCCKRRPTFYGGAGCCNPLNLLCLCLCLCSSLLLVLAKNKKRDVRVPMLLCPLCDVLHYRIWQGPAAKDPPPATGGGCATNECAELLPSLLWFSWNRTRRRKDTGRFINATGFSRSGPQWPEGLIRSANFTALKLSHGNRKNGIKIGPVSFLFFAHDVKWEKRPIRPRSGRGVELRRSGTQWRVRA